MLYILFLLFRHKLKRYFLNIDNSKAFETLLNLEVELMDVQFKNVKKTKITDFFEKMINIQLFFFIILTKIFILNNFLVSLID